MKSERCIIKKVIIVILVIVLFIAFIVFLTFLSAMKREANGYFLEASDDKFYMYVVEENYKMDEEGLYCVEKTVKNNKFQFGDSINVRSFGEPYLFEPCAEIRFPYKIQKMSETSETLTSWVDWNLRLALSNDHSIIFNGVYGNGKNDIEMLKTLFPKESMSAYSIWDITGDTFSFNYIYRTSENQYLILVDTGTYDAEKNVTSQEMQQYEYSNIYIVEWNNRFYYVATNSETSFNSLDEVTDKDKILFSVKIV